ncbi:MAG: hypothetical protein H8E34_11525 [Bacteroidetes bacterium]|nr:hypothetical protein [Bacteroidota bacterium]MBL6944403.1 hypothetical protein [Bacteroidales bacterium]
MLREDFTDRLKQRISICELHHHRMMFAKNSMGNSFPLNVESYRELSGEQISYTDQLIYRFSKLQDTIGNKLFPIILEGLQEDIENLPFIDLLSKIEKLGLIDTINQWLILREIRNIVTHEYPFQIDQLIDGLNQLNEQLVIISKIWNTTKIYSEKRFGI